MGVLLLSILPLFAATTTLGLDNGLARTPPMGFNSWQRFRCNVDCDNDPDNCISERLYEQIADAMVERGFRDAGYEFVNIDDCWSERERGADGLLTVNATRFPNGIAHLADYVHARRLKLGIYQDVGTHTCGGYPGMLGHEQIDVTTLASWKIDYVKLDGCYADVDQLNHGYPLVSKLFNESAYNPIVISCEWSFWLNLHNVTPDYEAIARTCNHCRHYCDVQDSYESVKSVATWFAEHQSEFVAGPGAWNDPDMLIVGDYGLTLNQMRAQFALWAVMAAPLLISADVRAMQPEHEAILLNRDVIAVNQDPLGIPGGLYKRDLEQPHVEGRVDALHCTANEAHYVWIWRRRISPIIVEGPSSHYSYAIVVWNGNTGGSPLTYARPLTHYGLDFGGGYRVKDLYSGHDYGVLKPNDTLSVLVDPSGAVVMLRANPVAS